MFCQQCFQSVHQEKGTKICKSILKCYFCMKILFQVEQLSEYTDEETVVLSANVSDGTLSHLGSKTGKNFLEKEKEIKSKFLGFCLKCKKIIQLSLFMQSCNCIQLSFKTKY